MWCLAHLLAKLLPQWVQKTMIKNQRRLRQARRRRTANRTDHRFTHTQEVGGGNRETAWGSNIPCSPQRSFRSRHAVRLSNRQHQEANVEGHDCPDATQQYARKAQDEEKEERQDYGWFVEERLVTRLGRFRTAWNGIACLVEREREKSTSSLSLSKRCSFFGRSRSRKFDGKKFHRVQQMRIADYDNEVENRRRFLHMDELSDDEKLTKLHLPNHWNNYNLLGLMLTTKLIWQAPQLVIRHGGCER